MSPSGTIEPWYLSHTLIRALLLVLLAGLLFFRPEPELFAASSPTRLSKQALARQRLKQLKQRCKRHPRRRECKKLRPAPSVTPTPAPTSERSPEASPTPLAIDPGIPDLSKWEANMLSFGSKHCASIRSGQLNAEQQLAATYYDAQAVFQQIQEYTNDSSWSTCAQAARKIYRDHYVIPNAGRVPAYWSFTSGLTEDALLRRDIISHSAVMLLAHQAAFALDESPLAWTESSVYSREVAYTILAYLHAENLGEARRPRLAALVDQALGHINQWFIKRNAPYVRPFMVGLTARALITYHSAAPDPRIEPALRIALEELWRSTWVESSLAFRYTDRLVNPGDLTPAPDLNLLIAPAYAWMYLRTGDLTYRNRADLIFKGGVAGAYLGNPKQFNQNYLWSFDLVRWRQGR